MVNPEVDAREVILGAIELHTHSAPSRFPRVSDDWDLQKEAAAAGMGGIVLKAHEGCTAERAFLLNRHSPTVTFYGGLTLNHSVGGLNPAAVETALALGARIIWLPTVSAAHHHAFFRSAGRTFLSAGQLPYFSPGLSVLDESGRLRREVSEILNLVLAQGAILATGHSSPEEVVSVADAFLSHDGARLLVTHPDLNISSIPLDLQQVLAQKGAYLEKCALALEEDWGSRKVSEMVHSIRHIGAERCVVVTDAGMAGMPAAPTRLRHFVSLLLEQGIGVDEIRQMIVRNPAQLLDHRDSGRN